MHSAHRCCFKQFGLSMMICAICYAQYALCNFLCTSSLFFNFDYYIENCSNFALWVVECNLLCKIYLMQCGLCILFCYICFVQFAFCFVQFTLWNLLFGQSGSSSPYNWLCHSVRMSQLASREVSRVAIGIKAVYCKTGVAIY